jgi:type IV pilus assembly protein PilM
MSDRVIGLDIGASSVKAAQVLRKSDGTCVVEKQAARPLPRGAVNDGRIASDERGRVSDTIKKMIAEENFATKEVIFGLNSSSAVFMQEMTAPLMKPEDIEKTIPNVILVQNPNLDPKENEISFTVLGEQEGENGPELKILVYTVRADYAREIAEVVEAAGLTVVGADLNALAVLRAINIQNRPADQLDAIVDIGSNITILMLHHNGIPKFLALDPDSAGYVATDKVADALGYDDHQLAQAEWEKVNNEEPVGLVAQARQEYGQALAAKVAGGFNSYLEKSVEHSALANVTLVGGGSLLHGLGFFLRNSLGATVPLSYAQWDPAIKAANGGEVERSEIGSGGDYLVAVGLGSGKRL